MGISKIIAIEPYIEMTYTPKDIIGTSMECSIHGAILKSDGLPKFCLICGAKLKEIEIKKIQPMNYYALLREVDPNGIYEDSFLWVCKDEKPLIVISGEIGGTDTDRGIYEITPEIIATALRKFREHHKDLIALLRENTNTFAIKFGALTYYN